MNTTIIKEPFVHSLNDDFLSKEDFDFLLEHVKSRPLFLAGSNHYTEIFMNKEQSDLSRRMWKYCDIILDEIFDKVNVENKQYDKDKVIQGIELYNWGDDSYKDIHVDEFEKIVSSTLYIYPEEQMGTVLYGHELSSGNEIADVPFPVEWKQNRLMSFVSGRRTYHSVDKFKGQPRVTINFNSKYEVGNNNDKF
jgi:hypothetical protein